MERKSTWMLAGAALVAAGLFAGAADAQSAKHKNVRESRGQQYFDPMNEAPPLTVSKRPFTDSGTQVPVGYMHDYMVEQTTLNTPAYAITRPDSFGRNVLPGRFGELGGG